MKKSAYIFRQLVVSALVLVGLALFAFVVMRPAKSQTNSPSVSSDAPVSQVGNQVLQIQTAIVKTETLSSDLNTSGAVSYPADQTVKISPRLQGKVRDVYVKVGDSVKTGQTLAVLDSIDAASATNTDRQNQNKLSLTRANLDRAQRLFDLGTPEVTQAQANLDQARAHTAFTSDALTKLKEQAAIGGFTQKPLEDAKNALVSANSTLAQAQSDLAQAQRDHDRKTKLVEIGVVSKSDLEASQNVLEKAQAGVQAGQEQVVLAKQAVDREQKAFKTNLYADQQVRSGENDYRQAQLQESAAVTALRLTKTAVRAALEQARSDYAAAKADAENSRSTLGLLGHPDADGTMRIQAPESGIVVERDVNPGQVVDQSQATPWQMFVISNANTVWVDADVYEKDIQTVRPGEHVSIRVAALPGRLFSGEVLHVMPTLDSKSRSIKVRAQIPNPRGELKDGMYADVTIQRTRGRAVTVVPLEAIQHDGDSDYVYVGNDGKYAKRKVKLGVQRGDLSVVLDGLKPGERVVTHGALFLGDQASSG